MDFMLTDEQELLLDGIGEFLDTCGFGERYLKKCYDEHRMPTEYFQAFDEAGFGMLCLPEEYGGTPFPFDCVTMMLVNELTFSKGFPTASTA